MTEDTDRFIYLCNNISKNDEKGDIMCMPHARPASGSKTIKTKDRPKKHISKVSIDQFEKGDPDFIDERIETYTPKIKKSFLDKVNDFLS